MIDPDVAAIHAVGRVSSKPTGKPPSARANAAARTLTPSSAKFERNKWLDSRESERRVSSNGVIRRYRAGTGVARARHNPSPV